MKILGIYLYPESKEICRVLKPGWFPFTDIPEPQGENKLMLSPDPSAVDRVYSTAYRPHISINAIVGMNGAGKSTILDILFKIINNFVIRIIGRKLCDNDFRHLNYAYGVFADLFYDIEGIQQKIKCRNTDIELFHEEGGVFIKKSLVAKNRTSGILENFFYTIVTNYSLYAYNTQDYDNEIGKLIPKGKTNGSWLEGLFHKNDGYFTPLVITPYRSHGTIDIQKESYLAERRINTMALLAEANGKNFISGYRPTTLFVKINPKFLDEKKSALRKSIQKKDEWIDINAVLGIFRREWIDYINEKYSVNLNSSEYKKIQQLEYSIFYLAYKTLKLALFYPDYRRRLDIDRTREPYYKTHDAEFYEHYLPKRAYEIISLIVRDCNDKNDNDEEHNHLILKIDQILTYLKDYFTTGVFTWKDSEQIRIKTFLSGKKIKKYCDLFRIMPPAFYNTHLEFTKFLGNREKSSWHSFDRQVMRLSMMSSGERHLLNCLSYVLYHIKNIESIKSDKERIKYRHICLVFDEVELYFHPDYQRRFIKMLLEALDWCNISVRSIKSIQLLIVTHSPFILTDIFTHNTLYLKDGKSVTVEGQTFGANYYDILNNSFFFQDSAVGEVSTEFIRGLIPTNKKYSTNKVKALVNFVGDPMIRQFILNNNKEERNV